MITKKSCGQKTQGDGTMEYNLEKMYESYGTNEKEQKEIREQVEREFFKRVHNLAFDYGITNIRKALLEVEKGRRITERTDRENAEMERMRNEFEDGSCYDCGALIKDCKCGNEGNIGIDCCPYCKAENMITNVGKHYICNNCESRWDLVVDESARERRNKWDKQDEEWIPKDEKEAMGKWYEERELERHLSETGLKIKRDSSNKLIRILMRMETEFELIKNRLIDLEFSFHQLTKVREIYKENKRKPKTTKRRKK